MSLICYEYLESFCRTPDHHKDFFWFKLLNDVEHQLSSSEENPFVVALKNCLYLHKSYQEILGQLKDLLLAPSAMNIASGGMSVAGKKAAQKGTKKVDKSSATTNGTTSNFGSVLSISFDPTNHFHGIALNQMEKIMEHFNQFQARIIDVLEIRKSVDQLQSLPIALEGLPHILGIWNIDFLLKENRFETYEIKETDTTTLLPSTPAGSLHGAGSGKKQTDGHQSHHSHGHWGVSAHHRKSPHSHASGTSQQSQKNGLLTTPTPVGEAPASRSESRKHANISRASHLDDESEDTEHTSVATMVLLFLKKALFDLKSSCAKGFTVVFDTDSALEDVFPEALVVFKQNVAAIEENLAEYIKVREHIQSCFIHLHTHACMHTQY